MTVLASGALVFNFVFTIIFIQADCETIVCAFAKIFLTMLVYLPMMIYTAYSVAIFAWFMRYVWNVQKIK